MRILKHGDNLPWLRELPTAAATLVATDPPYCSQRDWGEFDDRWGRPGPDDWEQLPDQVVPQVHDAIAWHSPGMGGFLAFMAPRIEQIARVLDPARGTLYMFCDDVAGARLRIMLDALLPRTWRTLEIAWRRAEGGYKRVSYWDRNTDRILCSRGPDAVWQAQYEKPDEHALERRFRDTHRGERGRWDSSVITPRNYGNVNRGNDAEFHGLRPPPGRFWRWSEQTMAKKWHDGVLRKTASGKLTHWVVGSHHGMPMGTCWTDCRNPSGTEHEGYHTQKPLKLMYRLIHASSEEGDLVVDPFCGSGSTLVAAERMQRRWAGCDKGDIANEIARARLDAECAGLFGGPVDHA